jgi:glutamate-1-semialdehyde 2,1-aminomutase
MGDCFAQPTPDSVALAECLVETVSGMDWCAFAKNGSDALATAIVVARAATGRRKLVCARDAYHGSHFWSNWCSPGPGRLMDDSRDVLLVDWNDADELAAVLDSHGQDVAAVVMTPFHHPIAAEAVMPDPGWWKQVDSLARKCGALIIVDDVRTGYRLSLAGSHAYFGLDADLVCQSKALGNTYPIAVTLGADRLRGTADAIFAAGTFWGSAAPMAAALENLRQLRDTDGVDRMWALGRRLCDGLERTGAAHGVVVRMTGAPTLPTMTIDGDDGSAMVAFTTAMAELGSFMHPSHNWFISAAHTETDVDETLAHADAVFAAMAGAAPLAAVALRD